VSSSTIERVPVASLEIGGIDRVLYALQPKQLEAFDLTPLAREPDEPYPEHIGYGGAAGGGKSYFARAVATAAALMWPGSRSIIFRRTEGEVKENHVKDFRTEVPDEIEGVRIYGWNGDDLEASWYNGSTTRFGYLKTDDDVFRYQGPAYDLIIFEEATHYSWFQVSWLTGNRLRANTARSRPFVVYPSNPGSKGHYWYKRLFIDKNYYTDEGEEPHQYAFVQAKLADNYVLKERDPRYAKRLDRLPEPWRSWQRDGDFAAGAGAMLSELNRDVHLIKPFRVPGHWTRFGSFDWGYAHPWVFGEYAVNEDGRCFKLQTIAGIRDKPQQIADKINAHVNVSQLAYISAGWDAWHEKKSMSDDTPTIAESLETHGISLVRANIQRVSGLQNLKRYLEYRGIEPDGTDGVPQLVFFNNPGNFETIQQLESMTPDPDNLEDVLKVNADEFGRGGDDRYDETRYAMASRPQAGDEVFGSQHVDPWEETTLLYEAEYKLRHWDSLVDPNESVIDPILGEIF
jgi:phage terminase large subunit